MRADADTGYLATNTVDGSGLNTALRDSLGAISVFTREFTRCGWRCEHEPLRRRLRPVPAIRST
jgi:hypothetical protein